MDKLFLKNTNMKLKLLAKYQLQINKMKYKKIMDVKKMAETQIKIKPNVAIIEINIENS